MIRSAKSLYMFGIQFTVVTYKAHFPSPLFRTYLLTNHVLQSSPGSKTTPTYQNKTSRAKHLRHHDAQNINDLKNLQRRSTNIRKCQDRKNQSLVPEKVQRVCMFG